LLTQYEITLTDYEISAYAESEIKFVPSYAEGIFHICFADISLVPQERISLKKARFRVLFSGSVKSYAQNSLQTPAE